MGRHFYMNILALMVLQHLDVTQNSFHVPVSEQAQEVTSVETSCTGSLAAEQRCPREM